MDSLIVGGETATLSVVNDGDIITISSSRSSGSVDSAESLLASPSACADSASSWKGVRNNGWTYRVNMSGLASGVTASDWAAEIASAELSLESGYNDCGKPQGSSLFSAEMSRGADVTAAAMTASGGCIEDNVRIMDFGYLASPRIGQACKWWTTNIFGDDPVYEADVRLLRSGIWFRYKPSTCSNKYEMAGVLTHEFGHVFGLEHVAESTHGNLTFSESSTPCSYADRSLGLGDYNNLNTHY